MKKLLITTVALFSVFAISAENLSLNSLLTSWLENDRDIKSAALSLQKAELSDEENALSNGFDINLSTGTMRFQINNGNAVFSLSPSVEAKFPEIRNLSLSAGSDITLSSDSEVSNASIKAGIDILDTNKEKRELTEKKSIRSILEAKRSLEGKIQSSEKSFYQEVKSLLKTNSSIISSQNNLYSDTISFEKTKAQGYASTSSTYRLAEMKVRNDMHTIETSERTLAHDYEIFLLKCSSQKSNQGNVPDISFEDFLKMVSETVASVELINIEDFQKENYKEIEKATWDQEINALSREADKNYSLKGSAGYTFNNSSTKTGSGKSSDSIDIGVSSAVLGMNISAGVSVPVNPLASPAFTAGVSFSPNTLKKQKLTEKGNLISEQSDSLSLETALYNYNITLADKKQSKEDLIWEQNSINENLEMYTQTESEMRKYYDKGLISLSEYLSAKNNKEKYETDKLVNKLDIIIYNNEIKSLFYGE